MRVYLIMAGIAVLAAGLLIGCGDSTGQSATTKAPDTTSTSKSDTTPIAEAPPAPDTAEPDQKTDVPAEAAEPAPPEEPAAAEAAPAEPVPDVIAKVNDQEISGKEYERNLQQFAQIMRMQGMGGEVPVAKKREILEQMVNNAILTQLAQKAGVKYTREDAEAEIQKAKEMMPDRYEQSLKRMNITEEELIGLLQDQKLRQEFIKQKLEEDPVTEEELQAEYNNLKEMGNLERKEETADVQHILIKVEGTDEAAWEEGKKKIDAARKRIVEGKEDFGEVASEVTDDTGSKSRGGAYPGTSRGRMVPEFDELMWSLPIDEVSEPFRTQYGWHIMKVNARHEKGTMELDEIRDQMKYSLENRKAQKIAEDIANDARKDMKVEIFYHPGGEEAPAEEAPAKAEAPAEEAPAKAEAPAEEAPAKAEAADKAEAPAADQAPADEAKPDEQKQ